MRLHINVDHIATVRQARRTDEPDPVRAAVLAEIGGADGITVHLREDRRHIQDRDVRLLIATVRTGVNLELAAGSDVLTIACEVCPMEATLVPERRQEITTEGGLDLSEASARRRVEAAISRLHAAGIRTSLFIGPDAAAVAAAGDLGASAVELNTGEFAEAWKERGVAGAPDRVAHEMARIRDAAADARGRGLAVHAGHGLTYENVGRVAAVREIEELNIGHSVVSRALFIGMERAVREMKDLVDVARRAQGTRE